MGREARITDAYLNARPSRDLMVVDHRQVTREWWERCHASTGGTQKKPFAAKLSAKAQKR
jgi:hypothetical protein